MDRTIPIATLPELMLFHENEGMTVSLSPLSQMEGVSVYQLKIKASEPTVPKAVTVRWKLPYVNMLGVWKPGGIHDKRTQYDWELEHLLARISVDAPVISVFGGDDQNGITFACSDTCNLLEMNAVYREEDWHLYCHVSFFTEATPALSEYSTEIRIDTRSIRYDEALQAVSQWWEGYESMRPAPVPALAKAPLYSTWYQFHQALETDILVEECTLARELGYELIIIDDGWQTLDTHRGYDYTGDWLPERFPDMAGLVSQLKATGMKVGIWLSVPFCGKHSQAYQRFTGKFLTENHRWAPVFDPRYPEVREYLVNIYREALINWKLDAFKLDFIDDFRVYPETELTLANGRDFANVNAAVYRLLEDVGESLRAIKPDIAIEFRQQYIGPAMRRVGNMFRAFDCPNDPVTNRIRTTDVKLLCGKSAVHSDPLSWHPKETLDRAALQFLNAFFSVPQLSVHLRHASPEHLQMIRFYTQLWQHHAAIVMEGSFQAEHPLANYDTLIAEKENRRVMGIYGNAVVKMADAQSILLLNARYAQGLILDWTQTSALYELTVWNVLGAIMQEETIQFTAGIHAINIPVAGVLQLRQR